MEALSRGDVEKFMAPFRANFVTSARKFVRDMFIPRSDPTLVDWVVADMSATPPEIALPTLEEATTYDRKIVTALRA